MRILLMSNKSGYKDIGIITWKNIDHAIRVHRDWYMGGHFNIDHFELNCTLNSKRVPSPLTETGYHSFMKTYMKEEDRYSDSEFLSEIRKQLGEEPQQKELML